MKYLVMETFTSYAVVLDEEGRFIKAANMNYTPGQTVSDIFPMMGNDEELTVVSTQVKAKPVYMKRFIALAACFVLMFAGLFRFLNTPYASVYIKINPSVRIDVDKNDIVKSVRGTNRDGEALVKNYNGKGKQLNTAVDELIDLAIDMGYLYDGGQISVTFDGESTWVENHSRQLTDHINTYVEEKITITIRIGDYTANNNTGTQVTVPATDYGDTDYGQQSSDSNYREPDEGRTIYDEPEETPYKEQSQSRYSRTDYSEEPVHKDEDGESNYTDGMTDYGNQQSNYAQDSKSNYDSDSGYDNSDEGDSGYD